MGYLVSDLLMSVHAFSTRLGGVSRLEHTSALNLAFGRGDEREVVLENLSLFGGAVGFDPMGVVSVPQVHGNTVHEVDACHRGMGYHVEAAFEGDGYVTADPSVTLGVKTADCTPILLEASVGGHVVAVAALHAGWNRGGNRGGGCEKVDLTGYGTGGSNGWRDHSSRRYRALHSRLLF